MKRFIICLLLLLNSVVLESLADPFENYYFESIGDRKGTQPSTITALIQDNAGFIWMGTTTGLIRYDGYRFLKFQYDPKKPTSLAGNHVRTLHVAKDGRIFIGSNSGGLSIFDPQTSQFERFQHNTDDPNSLAHDKISSIVTDDKNGVWLATKNGLDYLNLKTRQFIHYVHDPDDKTSINHNWTRALLLDVKGDLWIGNQDGLNRLKSGTNQFERIYSDKNIPDSFSGQQIRVLKQAKDGKIWVGTRNSGASWINPETQQIYRIPVDESRFDSLSHPLVIDIVQVDADRIWIGTYGGGLNLVDAYSGELIDHLHHDAAIPSSLNSDTIGSLLVDRAGSIWIGTWGAGLNRVNPNNGAFRTLRHSPTLQRSLSHPDVFSLLELDNGEIWIGSHSKGIDILNMQIGIIDNFPDSEIDSVVAGITGVSSMTIDNQGRIWIGTSSDGVFRYDFKTKSIEQYPVESFINALLASPDGNIWVGTDFGLQQFDTSSSVFKHLPTNQSVKQPNQVRAMILDEFGKLWVGTDNGLFILEKQQNILKQLNSISNSKTLFNKSITGLLFDSQNRLLITNSDGLHRTTSRKNENLIFESLSDRLKVDSVSSDFNLLEDGQGRIWTGSYVYDLKRKRRYQINPAFGVDIGKGGWLGTYTKTKDGKLLYGGSHGMLIIDPEKFTPWEYDAPVVISKLWVNGETQTGRIHDSEITLSGEDKGFTVEFASLDLSAPEDNRYAYRLEGFDQDWILTDSDNRTASYTNLSHGDYVLHIKGSNRVAQWSDKMVALSITVLPLWHQTWWFKLLIILLIFGFIYLAYSLKTKQLKRRKQELIVQVKLRTAELETLNKNISTLSKIGAEITSSLDLDTILTTVHHHLNDLMDTSVFYIGLHRTEEEEIQFITVFERGIRLAEFSISTRDKEKLAVKCLKTELPVIINDIENYKKFHQGILEEAMPRAGEQPKSLLYWPLKVSGRTIGMMSVRSFNKNAFETKQQEIFMTIASYTSIAIDNANAYQEAEIHRDIAEQTTKQKSQFLANMSHEIRTPLHGILGLTNLMKFSKDLVEQDEYIDKIDLSANSLLRVINDILDFSKVEAGTIELESTNFSFANVLQNVATVIVPLVDKKGLVLRFIIDPYTPAIFVSDPIRISQVILNLCSNAIKFTVQGRIEVKVTPEFISDELCKLTIDVIDQGIGIDQESLSNLFSNYTQADASTSRKYGGTGLGLPISKRIANLLQGDIFVSSQVGQGSCFSFISTVKIGVDSPAKFQQKPSDNFNKQTLLFCDDQLDSDNQTLIASPIGRIFECENELVGLLKRLRDKDSNYRNLVVDCHSASEKIEALFNMLRQEFGQHIRLIVISQNQHTFTTSTFAKYKLKVLQKPISYDDLYEAIYKTEIKSIAAMDEGLKGIRVLVAEDNKVNQLIAKKLLNRLGMIVDIAEDGAIAVAKTLEKNYGLILMDIQMPTLDGIDATKQIRANGITVPIIAMTANLMKEDIEKYRAVGMTENIGKPFNTKVLQRKISSVLSFSPPQHEKNR